MTRDVLRQLGPEPLRMWTSRPQRPQIAGPGVDQMGGDPNSIQSGDAIGLARPRATDGDGDGVALDERARRIGDRQQARRRAGGNAWAPTMSERA